MAHVRIASDVGGTFTDVVAFDEQTGRTRFGKALTTPIAMVHGILNGIQKSGEKLANTRLFLHGTTVAINTMLERTGARTALITTQGFRDIYEIGRINRPDAYNLFFQKHQPLIPRSLRFEINERMRADGSVLRAPTREAVAQICVELKSQGIEAVAILLLHAYANPVHELQIRQWVQEALPGVFVTASHELSTEYREFERTSTVAANAYVGPRVSRYLKQIDDTVGREGFSGGFFVVQSSGGLFSVQQAQRECIRMLESGPAAGVIGTRSVCERLKIGNAIAFDMGGTTAKAGVVLDGEVMMAGSIMVGGYSEGLPIQVPLIDIQEVGTGGGSIARVETGGSLHVGPQSAGASPGPVCYALGGEEPTVTDANLILGRIAPDKFLGGEMPLDLQAARSALQRRIAEPLNLDLHRAALGIIQIATITMSHVVTRVTTERGLDAGDFAMVAYGGAGPLHASLVARELRMPTVIIPLSPGHFSATGMLQADLRRDAVRTWFKPLGQLDFDEMEAIFTAMEQEGRAAVLPQVGSESDILMRRGADMRYVGQEHAVTVDLPIELFTHRDLAGIKRHFDEEHLKRYGFDAVKEPAELVSLHSSVIGQLERPRPERLATGEATPSAPIEVRPVLFELDSGFVQTPVYARDKLMAGNQIKGPALIEEYASTTVVLPGDELTVSPYGDLIIKINHE